MTDKLTDEQIAEGLRLAGEAASGREWVGRYADKAFIAHASTHHAAALRDLQEAKRLAEFWESEAARNHRDAQFYRGIVTATGELLGPECKRSDDGSMQGEPLVLKVTELVAAALREVQALRQQVQDVIEERDKLAQFHGGHLPECAGMDMEQMRCGCGYLDGTAYRELVAQVQTLTEERDMAREMVTLHHVECHDPDCVKEIATWTK